MQKIANRLLHVSPRDLMRQKDYRYRISLQLNVIVLGRCSRKEGKLRSLRISVENKFKSFREPSSVRETLIKSGCSK